MTDPPLGAVSEGDCLPWLDERRGIDAALLIADPPYGIGKADWDRFPSEAAWLAFSRSWLERAAATLAKDGSAYVLGFSEPLARLMVAADGLFDSVRWLVWTYRNRANLRADWGRSHESILHLRKGRRFRFDVDAVRVPYNAHTARYPQRRQGDSSNFGPDRGGGWAPHAGGAKPRDVFEIPTLNNGMAEKTPHPTQKPLELIRRFVAASSREGDLVLDPFGGSGTTAVVCELLGRRWAICEAEPRYVELARTRIDAVRRGAMRVEDLDRAIVAMARNRAKVRAG